LLHSYFEQIEFGALPLRTFISLQAVGVKNSIQDENSLKSCLKIDNI